MLFRLIALFFVMQYKELRNNLCFHCVETNRKKVFLYSSNRFDHIFYILIFQIKFKINFQARNSNFPTINHLLIQPFTNIKINFFNHQFKHFVKIN